MLLLGPSGQWIFLSPLWSCSCVLLLFFFLVRCVFSHCVCLCHARRIHDVAHQELLLAHRVTCVQYCAETADRAFCFLEGKGSIFCIMRASERGMARFIWWRKLNCRWKVSDRWKWWAGEAGYIKQRIEKTPEDEHWSSNLHARTGKNKAPIAATLSFLTLMSSMMETRDI
jgi:hypothetical protein